MPVLAEPAPRIGLSEAAEMIGVARRPAERVSAESSQTITATIADEVPVALVYNGLSHAVMMASPVDLAPFALGFSLSEGLLASPEELLDLEIVPVGAGSGAGGFEIRMRIIARRFAGIQDRRRVLTGRTGCGLCGIDSLAQAVPVLPVIESDVTVELAAIRAALAALPARQTLNRAAGAVHAAAWADLEGGLVAVAEDVGRHNALDKLIGTMASVRPPGFLLLTSRCSFELVAKAVTVGMPILVAISAPTGLALDMAERAGLTVVALARADAMTIYTHPNRILGRKEAAS